MRGEIFTVQFFLFKSRFIEMFGNPGVNEFSYPEYTIGELAKDYSYGTSSKANDKGLTPYLRMGNMTDDGKIDLSDLKYITLDHKEYEKSVVRDGDLLFNRTNSADHVGRTCAFHSRQDMVIAGYIVRVRLKQELSLADYVAGYMNSTYMKGYLKSIAKRAVNQANISASAMAKIKIFVPPIEKQKEYLGFLKLVDKSEFVVHSRYLRWLILTFVSSTIAYSRVVSI